MQPQLVSREDKLSALIGYSGGLHLRDSLLWFDASEPRDFCFISHAAVVGAQRHARIVTTQQTLSLMQSLGPKLSRRSVRRQALRGVRQQTREMGPRALTAPYGQVFGVGTLGLELFPSGYLAGAASVRVTWRGTRVVYAGLINPRPSRFAAPLEVRPCDLLVLPYACGTRHRQTLPPAASTEQALLKFVKQTLADRETPVLLCPPLGTAQELVALLSEHKIATRVHPQIMAATQAYVEHQTSTKGALDLSLVRPMRARVPATTMAVVWPQSLAQSVTIQRLQSPRRALVAAELPDDETRLRLRLDASFPMSPCADYAGLLEYVRACGPRRVLLIGTQRSELTGDLRALGFDAEWIGPRRQLNLFE